MTDSTADIPEAIAERLSDVFPRSQTLVATVGAGLAGHSGPWVLAVITLVKE